jgi:type IV pilus assembly protein PilC
MAATITYRYRVRDTSGKVVTGKLEGDGRDAVSAKLRQMGYIVLDLTEDRIAQMNKIQFGSSVKAKDITIFARQFATMINAGLSLTKCLTILAAQSERKELRDVVAQLTRDVESGQPLSDALVRHPKIFPPIFVNMVRAGETGGVLDTVLLRVADHFEQEAKLKGRIKSAMTYPVVMGALVLVVLVIMMVFVVPTFEEMFASMGSELPLPTQILISVSEAVRGWPGLVGLVVLVAGIFGFRKWISTTSGREIWDRTKLQLPVAGKLVRKTSLARFTRTFGTLVAAGVPLLSALDIVADTAGNAVVGNAVRRARAAIKEGDTIARPLSESSVFPSMVVQMIAVGEETGALDKMLSKVADFYDEEVSAAVDGLTSTIEPLMMATLGGVVGLIIVALYMPMFQMVALVQ